MRRIKFKSMLIVSLALLFAFRVPFGFSKEIKAIIGEAYCLKEGRTIVVERDKIRFPELLPNYPWVKNQPGFKKAWAWGGSNPEDNHLVGKNKDLVLVDVNELPSDWNDDFKNWIYRIFPSDIVESHLKYLSDLTDADLFSFEVFKMKLDDGKEYYLLAVDLDSGYLLKDREGDFRSKDNIQLPTGEWVDTGRFGSGMKKILEDFFKYCTPK